jgi:hypothetical protein
VYEGEGDEVGEGDEGEEPEDPSLTAEKIKTGLRQVGKTKNRRNEAYVRLEYSNKGLETLEGDLALFKELRYVNLSKNRLTSMEGLNELPNLIMADFRNNQIEDFDKLGVSHTQFTLLLLDHNKLSSFMFFDMPSLKYISLANNEVTSVTDLSMLSIPLLEIVNLNNNKLVSLEGFSALPNLKQLSCSSNYLTMIDGIEKSALLEELDVSNNQLTSIKEFDKLIKMQHFRKLNCAGNEEMYSAFETPHLLMLEMILKLPQMTHFNNEEITTQDRLDADKIRKDRIRVLEAKQAQEEAEAAAAAALMNADMKLDFTGLGPDGETPSGYEQPPETAMSTNITDEDIQE